jgi:hypothetical protein
MPSTPVTQAPQGATGSGLGTSGSGEVAAGRSPTPETGLPGWVLPLGLFLLVLASAARRLAQAAEAE